ncbi:MAG TPA: diguanylate cyclase [Clostridiales bacterium]|jgi:peptide/nickel transport system permease protein|nr:diguanylate cyclase [Clostridiales bacterium]
MDTKFISRFLKRKASVIGGIIIIIFILVALVGPFLCTQDPLKIDVRNKYESPSREHWLGTDNLGRDTFTRLVYGARITLMVSFTGVMLGTIVGLTLGVISGYYGGKVDAIIMRITDILLAFPGLLLAIAIVAILGNGLFNTMLAIAFYSIPYIARIVRGTVISIRELEFIQACQVIGCSDFTIIFFHIIPNSMSQVIVNTTLNLGTAILTSASLSFLGLGVQPPNPEWGAMLSQAREVMRTTPIAAITPGIAITLAVMSFSLLGDGLRDALDPKLKNS